MGQLSGASLTHILMSGCAKVGLVELLTLISLIISMTLMNPIIMLASEQALRAVSHRQVRAHTVRAPSLYRVE